MRARKDMTGIGTRTGRPGNKHRAQVTSRTLTLERVREVLTQTRGDILESANILDVPHWHIDRYIRQNQILQEHMQVIGALKVASEYEALSDQQFEREIARLALSFRLLALKELAQVAMLPKSASATRLYSKVKACMILYGVADVNGAERAEPKAILEELNAVYQASAPRIKEIRQTVVKLMDGSLEEPAKAAEPALLPDPSQTHSTH